MDELSQRSMQRTKFRRKSVLQANRSVLILRCLENEGHPLWNGRDEIFIRKAFPAEESQFEASQARAIEDKEIDEDDDWLMFLVPVTDPMDDFDPYDAPGG